MMARWTQQADRRTRLLLPACLWIVFFIHGGMDARAGTPTTFVGRAVDAVGAPVSGARVYVYDSPRIKRPADFISAPTGEDGRFRIVLPPGQYWATALLRSEDGSLGPLRIGDKHSGDPVSFTMKESESREMDFTVLDLREAAKRHQKRNEDLVRISGVVMGRDGRPAPEAYVFADKVEHKKQLPAYVSAWTDESGAFELYAAKGPCYLGASRAYPLEAYHLPLGRQCEKDMDDVVIDLGNAEK